MMGTELMGLRGKDKTFLFQDKELMEMSKRGSRLMAKPCGNPKEGEEVGKGDTRGPKHPRARNSHQPIKGWGPWKDTSEIWGARTISMVFH